MTEHWLGYRLLATHILCQGQSLWIWQKSSKTQPLDVRKMKLRSVSGYSLALSSEGPGSGTTGHGTRDKGTKNRNLEIPQHHLLSTWVGFTRLRGSPPSPRACALNSRPQYLMVRWPRAPFQGRHRPPPQSCDGDYMHCQRHGGQGWVLAGWGWGGAGGPAAADEKPAGSFLSPAALPLGSSYKWRSLQQPRGHEQSSHLPPCLLHGSTSTANTET